jgi:hypothetical protein
MARSLVTFAVVLVLAGCGAPSGEPGRSPAAAVVAQGPDASAVVASASVAPAPSTPPTEEPLPSDLDPSLRHAIEFRRDLGMRHDLAYVLQAAKDPAARNMLLDFPMYPEEEAKLMAEQADTDVVVPIVQAHAAANADEFGGLYIGLGDERDDGVVTLWTGHLAEHEAAIRARLDPENRVAFRRVRYSEAFLRGIQDRISGDWDWLISVPAAPLGVGVDILENVVSMQVSSADPQAEAMIREHYGLGEEIRIESDGTGAHLLPYGKVVGVVLGPDGKPIKVDKEFMLDYVSTDPGVCGGGDIGYGVREDGTFEYPCQIGTRTIQLKQLKGANDSEWVVIGEATVRLIGSGAVRVIIRLSEEP